MKMDENGLKLENMYISHFFLSSQAVCWKIEKNVMVRAKFHYSFLSVIL